jgi:hypothetical protein
MISLEDGKKIRQLNSMPNDVNRRRIENNLRKERQQKGLPLQKFRINTVEEKKGLWR